MSYTIGYFVGSLAEGSVNRKFAQALADLAPENLKFTEISIKDLPLYSYDYDADYPAVARTLKQQIEAVDALVYFTPEYNRSIPGVLKNAIDWASRPWGQGSLTKPSAIAGVSLGAVGTAVAQAHLRQILGFFNAVLYTQPELYIQHTDDLYTAEGKFNEQTEQFLKDWLSGFEAFVTKQVG